MMLMAACGGTVETFDPVVSFRSNSESASKGSVFVEVQAEGEWTLSLDFLSAEPWATLSHTSGTGSKNNIILSFEENGSGGERRLFITVKCGSKSSNAEFLQRGEEIPATSPKGRGWLELPAIDTDTLDYYFHEMTVSGKKSRNYSFGWDKKNRLSIWVAYPLNAELIGSGSRTDAWALDPLVPEKEQPRLIRGSYKNSSGAWSGYSRGHQLPSADRLSREANMETFYGTNMTPQMGALNEFVWANLEKSVRNWSKQSDTLYVVTGCLVSDSPGIVYDAPDPVVDAADPTPRKITIPGHYFKALLRYSNGSTVGYSGYAAVGFIFDHKGYGDIPITKSLAISIDRLEELTGIDFFSNLPAVVGETNAKAIEAQDPQNVSWWWK